MLRRSLNALLLSLPLLAAGPAFAQEKPKVVTTFTIIADIAANVAGDAATVESITKPGAEIHNYQPTPRDILKAQDAEAGTVERPQPRTLVREIPRQSRRRAERHLSEGIEPMGITEGPYTGKPNPHAWMSPNNALIYVENIRKALGERSGQCRRPMTPMPRPISRRSGDDRADEGEDRGDPEGQALAGHERGRLQLSHPRFRHAGALSSGRSMPISRARRSRSARR
jgi:hypothetical protein